MKVPERYRYKGEPFYSDEKVGSNGYFVVPGIIPGRELVVIASDGMGWEHVSVSFKGRIPNWEEMYHVKNLFWDEEECVVQFHPPKSKYVNNCGECLHLWKPVGETIKTPPSILVGFIGKEFP